MSYWRFIGMIATSTLVMYGLMYLNTYAWAHIWFSESRVYMAAWMGAAMAAIMLLFMLGMYGNKIANVLILAGAAVVFAGALALFRTQALVQDEAWMRAMIPHHSIAILTSRRAELSDPRVQKLAAEIVEAQDREIAEMVYLLRDIERNGEAGAGAATGEAAEQPRIETLAEALSTPEITALDLAPMTDEDVKRALDGQAECLFRRAADAGPVLATAGGRGVVRVSGSLVLLAGAPDAMATEGLALAVAPWPEESGRADLVFETTTAPPLRVGYGGFWNCL